MTCCKTASRQLTRRINQLRPHFRGERNTSLYIVTGSTSGLLGTFDALARFSTELIGSSPISGLTARFVYASELAPAVTFVAIVWIRSSATKERICSEERCSTLGSKLGQGSLRVGRTLQTKRIHTDTSNKNDESLAVAPIREKPKASS